MAAVIENNAESLAATDLDAGDVRRLVDRWSASLDEVAQLLDGRREHGLVRHCHGDLHLRNIVLLDGRATLFDAIEFNDAFAEIDVLYDLAFLLMDLGYRGRADLASLVLNRYLDDTGGSEGLAALPLFLSLRAGVRALVDAAAARAHSDPARGATADRRRRALPRLGRGRARRRSAAADRGGRAVGQRQVEAGAGAGARASATPVAPGCCAPTPSANASPACR